MPKVYIVILNWNGLDDTIECIKSVFKLDYENYYILVVDNASNDNSVSVIAATFPDVNLIVNTGNLGFTGGNNVGIKYALEHGADYVWLLNNDTEVDSNCLKNMIIDAESTSNVGLVSPVVKFFENRSKTQFAGSYVNMRNLRIFYPNDNSRMDRYQTGDNICLVGTALLIGRHLIEKIGLLNDDFFAYWEDTEYSIRSLKNGFVNKVTNNALIYHKHQLSENNVITKSKYYYYYMNRNYFLMIKNINLDKKGYLSAYRRGVAQLIRNLSALKTQNSMENYKYALIGYRDASCKSIGKFDEQNMKIPLVKRILSRTLIMFYPFILSYIISGDFDIIYSLVKNKLLQAVSK